MSTETISVTVATSREGVTASTLSARLWHDGGEDHAEVRYEAGDQSFDLTGSEALAFLAMVARDAAHMLVGAPTPPTPPSPPDGSRVPGPRRPAGF